MVTETIEKSECTGCGACYQICKFGAIVMKADEKGFLYPEVQVDKCTQCGACVNVCVLKNNPPNASGHKVYAAWSKDKRIRYESTSGGIFSELANDILDNNGCVAGAAYTQNHLVQHCMIFCRDELKLLRQSKYVQSDTRHIYQEVKKQLEKGRKTLFVGTPCQCAGLINYLGKKHDQLILCDFICRGVNAPVAYQAYLEELQDLYNSKVEKVWFKNKSFGWNNFGTKIMFENGEEYFKDRNEDPFMFGFIRKNANLYMRSSCASCHFKALNTYADITLGDFWGYECSQGDDRYGVSAVILHTNKGVQLFNSLTSIYREESMLDKVIKGNDCLSNCAKEGKQAEFFWECMKKGMKFSTIIEKIKERL